MSLVLLVTALIAMSVEGVAPHGGLLVLTAVALVPAVLVDVLVFTGPRRRPFRDPLAARDEDEPPPENDDD